MGFRLVFVCGALVAALTGLCQVAKSEEPITGVAGYALGMSRSEAEMVMKAKTDHGDLVTEALTLGEVFFFNATVKFDRSDHVKSIQLYKARGGQTAAECRASYDEFAAELASKYGKFQSKPVETTDTTFRKQKPDEFDGDAWLYTTKMVTKIVQEQRRIILEGRHTVSDWLTMEEPDRTRHKTHGLCKTWITYELIQDSGL